MQLVPSHLVKSYGGVMPSKVTLRTDESEKSWKLSIEKLKDQYFFTDGWKGFEEEGDLKSREFLMFKSKQKGKNKEKRRKRSGDAHGTTNSSPNENKDKGSCVEKRLSFFKEMKSYHRYRLDIPKDFVTNAGILKGVEIKLKDSEGREWPVHVTKRSGVFSVCGGWCDFVTGNKVMIGNTISFAWLSGNTVQTQIVEVGTNKKPLFSSASKRGKQLELIESDKTSDQAELPKNSLMDVKSENKDDISEENGFVVGKRWRFSKDLKRQHAYTLDLHMDFSMVIGKATSGKIKLMDRKGRMWPVQVVKYRKCSSYRMVSGWIDFLVGNKVSVGSTVVFKSIPNCEKVIKVRVIDGGEKQKELFVKRARGRPSSCSKLSTRP